MMNFCLTKVEMSCLWRGQYATRPQVEDKNAPAGPVFAGVDNSIANRNPPSSLSWFEETHNDVALNGGAHINNYPGGPGRGGPPGLLLDGPEDVSATLSEPTLEHEDAPDDVTVIGSEDMPLHANNMHGRHGAVRSCRGDSGQPPTLRLGSYVTSMLRLVGIVLAKMAETTMPPSPSDDDPLLREWRNGPCSLREIF